MIEDAKVVGNWGGSLAVRINRLNASRISGISEGDKVELYYKKGQIIIKKSKEATK